MTDEICGYCQHPRSLHADDGRCTAEAKIYEAPPDEYNPWPAAIVGPCACIRFTVSLPEEPPTQ